MELFDTDPKFNILPKDGTVNYYGRIFDIPQANRFLNTLHSEIEWQHDSLVMFGKHIVTARRVAWYGDPGLVYRYSGNTKAPTQWTPELLAIRGKIQVITGETFNSCLLNLYDDGGQGMGWHSDDEKSLREGAPIASLSFGAERKFSFRHKITKERVDLLLDHGSLLVMANETQRFWQHSLPKSKKISGPRINLTFRTIEPPIQ